MADVFNPDFQDFLRALRRWQVEYILVGGYSVILHGYFRTTGDLDIWDQDLLTAKRAAGRPRDLNDLENLEPN